MSHPRVRSASFRLDARVVRILILVIILLRIEACTNPLAIQHLIDTELVFLDSDLFSQLDQLIERQGVC